MTPERVEQIEQAIAAPGERYGSTSGLPGHPLTPPGPLRAPWASAQRRPGRGAPVLDCYVRRVSVCVPLSRATPHKACTAHAGCCLTQHACAVAVRSPSNGAIGLSGIFGEIMYAILSSLLDSYGICVYSPGYGDA